MTRTIIPSSLKNFNAFLNSYPRITLIIRRVDAGKQRNIDTERLRRAFTRFADSLPEGFRVGLCQGR